MRAVLVLWRKLVSQIGHWPTYLLGSLLFFSQQMAHADVWGYIDEKGVAHFASEKLDDRYEIFYRGGESFDTSRTPKPPVVEVETQGKKIKEANPSDPNYLAALEARTETIGSLMLDLTLLRGMVVEELSADVVPYEDPAWAEELDYLGVSLPAKDCVERRLQWLRYMVVPTQEDLIRIRQVADSLSQLTEGEVRAAEESFQSAS